MRSLVMSLFSRDLLVNYIRYLQCLNLVNNYLHEYSIYTANQRAIVREGPDNRGSGLAGACTFQDKRIGQ